MVTWLCLNFSESDVRGALINSLKMDVVAPLQELKVRAVHYLHISRFSMFQILMDILLFNLKETHERSRKRIKEDIKSSLTQYNEYSENVLPRLKRLYIKRCQEADELKAAGDPKINSTSPIISNPILPKPGVPFPQNSPTSSQGAGVISTNMPTSGTERGRRQSTAASQGKRDRSPSSNTTSFSDLAQQGGSHALKCVGEYSRLNFSFLFSFFFFLPTGKRQLNNLRTLIDTRASRDGNDLTMRGVRAKREADEAGD
jgi:hypothetical protein